MTIVVITIINPPTRNLQGKERATLTIKQNNQRSMKICSSDVLRKVRKAYKASNKEDSGPNQIICNYVDFDNVFH